MSQQEVSLLETMKNRFRGWRGSLFILSVVSPLILPTVVASGEKSKGLVPSFALPRTGTVLAWEAERATRSGDWSVVYHAGASGGAYMKPASRDTRTYLDFPLNVSQPLHLRVWPEFWRHGDRTPPRRFPYPLVPRPGPNVIDSVKREGQDYLVITAPETARVALIDPCERRIVQTATLGGYLSDLVSDRVANRIYVADAVHNSVYVLSGQDLQQIATFAAGQCPWSLALNTDASILYVGCLRGKKLIALRTDNGQKVAELSLPTEVTHVTSAAGTPANVTLRLLPVVYDIESGEPIPADREMYGFGRRTSAECGARYQPGWKRFRSPRPHTLLVETYAPARWTQQEVDVRALTQSHSKTSSIPVLLTETPGPDVMVTVGNTLFFTSPVTGRVGIFDSTKNEVVKTLDLGGYLSDMAADPASSRVFVSDALGNRLVVISATDLQVQKEINVEPCPVSLEVSTAPAFLKSAKAHLLVACYNAKKVLRLDLASLRLTDEWAMPSEPAIVKAVFPPDPGWWPLISADRILMELRPRVAIGLAPRILDPANLTPIDTILQSPDFTTRNTVTLTGASGETTTFRVDDSHTVEVSTRSTTGQVTQKWIDVSSVTDWQETGPLPFSELDDPGPISFSLDGGPAQPWHRGIWTTPDQQQLLVYGTPEFWRWNAPIFALTPGNHTIRVYLRSPFVQLDGVKVERTLTGLVDMDIIGCGPGVADLSDRYRSVFYDREPVEFTLKLHSNLQQSARMRIAYRVSDYMGRGIMSGNSTVTVGPLATQSFPLKFDVKEHGTCQLKVDIRSELGTAGSVHYFLRVPKFERPRMLLRKDDMEAIRQRIRRNPLMFDRYFEWLRRQCEQKGFLPATVHSSTFGPEIPPERKPVGGHSPTWRRYDLAWRMLAVGIGGLFAPREEQRDYFSAKITELLKGGQTDYYCTFHHHGPFAPGVVAALTDLATANPKVDAKVLANMHAFFAKYMGDMNVFPWMMDSIDEPLDDRERALLWHIGMWLVNVERYFDLHMGTHGGQRWLNPRTWCRCPYAGYGYSFLYLRNWLHEPEYHHKKIVKGFFTHSEITHPMRDIRNMLGTVGHKGEPLRWFDVILSGHPLLEQKYDWSSLLQQLNAKTATDADIDRLLAYKESCQSDEPMGFVVPLAIALGWYHPPAPSVSRREIPPTAFFDVEGDAIMRSGWDETATEVFYTCGIRDHVYRHQPTHLQIARAGDFLLGTASSWGDDGNPAIGKSWGNIVIIEPSQWAKRWGENFWHPRAEEYCLINRFTDSNFRYIARDRRLTTYAPAEGGFGGGLDLHGHTESLLIQEGKMLAFETHPEYDYAAGDATNAWPVDLVDEVLRQIVFVKPDMVVVYDRVALGPQARRTFWMAATGEKTDTEDNGFAIRAGKSRLQGRVVLPEKCELRVVDPKVPGPYSTPPPYSTNWFLFDGNTRHQNVLEIHPAGSTAGTVEYLVVMRTTGEPEKKELVSAQSDRWKYTSKYPDTIPPQDAGGRRWFHPEYDDAAWEAVKSPFEVRVPTVTQPGTSLPPVNGSYFFRHTFDATHLPSGSTVELRVASDDAAEVYLNGQLIDRDPAFGKSPGHERMRWNRWVSVDPSLVREGENVVAVHVWNDPKSVYSYLEMELAVLSASAPLLPPVDSVLTSDAAGVRWMDPHTRKPLEITFRRTGNPGGRIAMTRNGKPIQRAFTQRVENTYRYWRSDPRFKQWMQDRRFKWIVPDQK